MKRNEKFEEIMTVLKENGVTEKQINSILDDIMNATLMMHQKESEGIDPGSIPEEELNRALGLSSLQGMDLFLRIEIMKLICLGIIDDSSKKPEKKEPEEKDELDKFIDYMSKEDVIQEMLHSDVVFVKNFSRFSDLVDNPDLLKRLHKVCLTTMLQSISWGMIDLFGEDTLMTKALTEMDYDSLIGKRLLTFISNYVMTNNIRTIAELDKSAIGNTENTHGYFEDDNEDEIESLYKDVLLIWNTVSKDITEQPKEEYDKIVDLLKNDLENHGNAIDNVTTVMMNAEGLSSIMYQNDLVTAFADDIIFNGSKCNYGSASFAINCIAYATNKYALYALRSVVIRSLLNTVIGFLNDENDPLTLDLYKEKMIRTLKEGMRY